MAAEDEVISMAWSTISRKAGSVAHGERRASKRFVAARRHYGGWRRSLENGTARDREQGDAVSGGHNLPNELRAASLSPVLTKQLKKEYGDSFLSKITQLTTEQEPHVKDLGNALGNFAVTREALNKRIAEPNAKKARTNKKDKKDANEAA